MVEHLRLAKALWVWCAVIASLAATLTWSLWFNNSAPQWPEPELRSEVVEQPAPVSSPVRIALTQYSAVWQTPLFVSGRQPDNRHTAKPVVPSAPSLENLSLTGIVFGEEVHVAMLKGPGNQIGTYSEGQVLPNGWTLARVEERRIELSYGQTQQILQLVTPRLPIGLP